MKRQRWKLTEKKKWRSVSEKETLTETERDGDEEMYIKRWRQKETETNMDIKRWRQKETETKT
ncbi:hypothetical protein F7725_013710 [Dissostichus mawsoni]|uniref:Uncharacterized protein n=1 Tax=Dissostichus mawsoni TaxID=36200 RepID=A0A7J5YTU2_DISMA|nr:hypothetical protein F7725_013710 [Dissostichus mawsoni]